MNLDKLKSIKISLMESQSDVIEETSKSECLVKASATFNVPPEFFMSVTYSKEDLVESLLYEMFRDLLEKNSEISIDTIGMWINYDDEIKENAIKLSTLNDMEEYSVEEITPIYEFFKLTLNV